MGGEAKPLVLKILSRLGASGLERGLGGQKIDTFLIFLAWLSGLTNRECLNHLHRACQRGKLAEESVIFSICRSCSVASE